MTVRNNKIPKNFKAEIKNILAKQDFTLKEDKLFKNIELLRKETAQSKIFNHHPNKKSAAELICKDTTPPAWGQFLYQIINHYNFRSCLELGTCLGFSGLYILAGLKQQGKLTTIEGLKDRADLAENNFKKLGYKNFTIHSGQFGKVLPDILSQENKFDFVYIDGHHKQQATLRYFDMIYPHLQNFSLLIIDDIHWPTEMQPAWKIISHDSRVTQSVKIEKWGICLIIKNFTIYKSELLH